MKCPRCKLINPETAQRCDCGYDFESKTVEQSYLPKNQKQDDPNRWKRRLRTLTCFAILFGGVMFADFVVSNLFHLPSAAIEALTKISLDSTAAVVAGLFALSGLFKRRLLTLKNSLIAAAALSLGIVFFVMWNLIQVQH